jgi:hypothetical protein
MSTASTHCEHAVESVLEIVTRELQMIVRYAGTPRSRRSRERT